MQVPRRPQSVRTMATITAIQLNCFPPSCPPSRHTPSWDCDCTTIPLNHPRRFIVVLCHVLHLRTSAITPTTRPSTVVVPWWWLEAAPCFMVLKVFMHLCGVSVLHHQVRRGLAGWYAQLHCPRERQALRRGGLQQGREGRGQVRGPRGRQALRRVRRGGLMQGRAGWHVQVQGPRGRQALRRRGLQHGREGCHVQVHCPRGRQALRRGGLCLLFASSSYSSFASS